MTNQQPASSATRPRVLAPGDLIGIAAPSSPIREEFLSAGERILEEIGFKVRRATHLSNKTRYTAGSADDRAADLNELFADPEVRAIWSARGGYGAPHLPPLLDSRLVAEDPKPFIGASDATALLLWLMRQGVACLHGPMPAQEIARDKVDRDQLLRLLTSPEPYGRMDLTGARTLHPGSTNGPVTGGCLSLVTASLGTPWEVETGGHILLIEDTNTKPYQIDRMLTQLDQAGKLRGARGILFGEMLHCEQTADQGYSLDDVLRDLTQHLGIPVLAGLPFGHTAGTHYALPFGVNLEMNADDRVLTLTEGLVSNR